MICDWNRSVTLTPPSSPQRRFQLIVSYFGPAHYGWQRQDSANVPDKSVQAFLEKAIFTISGEHSTVYGSGRTDSGVHALAQSAHFDSASIKNLDEERLRRAINANLPTTIRVNRVVERHDAFHARFSTFLREYEYVIKDDASWTPFDNERAWRLKRLPDISLLNRMAGFLLGDNKDYAAFDFSKAGDGHSTCRDVLSAQFFIRSKSLVFSITANAFLYHMVRAIVGTCVSLALKLSTEDAFSYFTSFFPEKGLTAARKATLIAPAYGLYLKRIIYDEGEYKRLAGCADTALFHLT